MAKGTNWLYIGIGAFIGYEVFFNPTSPIYFSNLQGTLANLSSLANGTATMVSTAASPGPVNLSSIASPGSTGSPSLGMNNSSIADIPITYYSQLLLKG